MIEQTQIAVVRPPLQTEGLALALFDAALSGRVAGKARRLLQLAVLYYAAAEQGGNERADRAGRDMALAAPLPGLSASQQSIVASVVAFQRPKIRPQRETSFVWLGEKAQHTALGLAALLRVATAIEVGPGELLIRADGDATTLVIGGDQSEKTIAAIEARAALWREVIGELTLLAAAPGAQPFAQDRDASESKIAEQPTLAVLAGAAPNDIGGEPVAEAVRRTLRRFFDKLLAREEAVLKDEDSEDVHQMRVATRRLRAALQTLTGVYQDDLIRRYRKGLRHIAGSLGAVRDGDVFLEHVLAHRDRLPEQERPALGPLIAAVTSERAQARATLLENLQSKRYQKFKREFAEFLCTPAAGAVPAPELGITQRVRDFAGSAVWRRYELWRAYEAALSGATNETLHQARIAGKRFRYTLEFFADALGPRVAGVLEPLIALQENLGELQDEVTARAHVAALGLADDLGAQAYLSARGGEREQRMSELPRLWGKVDSGTYRRRLFELIVKL